MAKKIGLIFALMALLSATGMFAWLFVSAPPLAGRAPTTNIARIGSGAEERSASFRKSAASQMTLASLPTLPELGANPNSVSDGRRSAALQLQLAEVSSSVKDVAKNNGASFRTTGRGAFEAEKATTRPQIVNDLLFDAPLLETADVSTIVHEIAPPLEIEREDSEMASSIDKIDKGKVSITSNFESSSALKVIEISPTHFVIDFEQRHIYWFMFHIKNAGRKIIRVDLDNVALNRWATLNPVYTYATDLSSSDTFAAPPVSDRLSCQQAYNGPLLPNTDRQQWHFIKDVWNDNLSNRLSFVLPIDREDAIVAMKVPYTPSYGAAYISSLQSRKECQVYTIGASAAGRKLQLVQIGADVNELHQPKPCILMYAREHADEHDTSWVVDGAMQFLLGESIEATKLRANNTFLFIPVLDPDGAADVQHNRIDASFDPYAETPESISYASFFSQWIAKGNRLDLVLDLHNVESAESQHLACPLMESGQRLEYCKAFHQIVESRLDGLQYVVRDTPWATGKSPTRLAGWLSHNYGSLAMPYEINSQEPTRHLSLAQLREMGQSLIQSSDEYLSSPACDGLENDIHSLMIRRFTARDSLSKTISREDWPANVIREEYLIFKAEYK